jgi:hypothetical protein
MSLETMKKYIIKEETVEPVVIVKEKVETPKKEVSKNVIKENKKEIKKEIISEEVGLSQAISEILHLLNEQKLEIEKLKKEKETTLQPIHIHLENNQEKKRSIMVKRDKNGNMIGAEVVEDNIEKKE